MIFVFPSIRGLCVLRGQLQMETASRMKGRPFCTAEGAKLHLHAAGMRLFLLLLVVLASADGLLHPLIGLR